MYIKSKIHTLINAHFSCELLLRCIGLVKLNDMLYTSNEDSTKKCTCNEASRCMQDMVPGAVEGAQHFAERGGALAEEFEDKIKPGCIPVCYIAS